MIGLEVAVQIFIRVVLEAQFLILVLVVIRKAVAVVVGVGRIEFAIHVGLDLRSVERARIANEVPVGGFELCFRADCVELVIGPLDLDIE